MIEICVNDTDKPTIISLFDGVDLIDSIGDDKGNENAIPIIQISTILDSEKQKEIALDAFIFFAEKYGLQRFELQR